MERTCLVYSVYLTNIRGDGNINAFNLNGKIFSKLHDIKFYVIFYKKVFILYKKMTK